MAWLAALPGWGHSAAVFGHVPPNGGSASFFSNFGDLFANSNDSGSGMVITLDPNDQLVLVGVHALNAGDFFFV